MEHSPTHNYKESRESVEGFLEMFEDDEFLRTAVINFFGLASYSPDQGMTTREDLLTEEELHGFKIFCKHVSKRIIAQYSKNDDGNIIVYGKKIEVKKLAKLSESESYPIYNILFHDLSHSVGQVARNNSLTELSPVQPYLRDRDNFNSKEFFEDELRGFIFGSLYYPMPTSNRVKLHLQQADTYETFEKKFLEKTISAALSDNRKALHEAFSESRNPLDIDEIIQLEKEAEKIGQTIIDSPPEDVIKALHYIWNHRDNPRVLVDLFFQEVGPYIEKLKERAPRDIYKDKEDKYDLKPSGSHDTDAQKE